MSDYEKFFNDKLDQYGTPLQSQFITQEDCPTRLCFVGMPIVGTADTANGYVYKSKEDGGQLRFAWNVWLKGENKCRKLEGSQSLFTKLASLDKQTAGLKNIWVIYELEGRAYQARFGGELTAEDKQARDAADALDLPQLCKWYKEESAF